jgi:hypothetical protein
MNSYVDPNAVQDIDRWNQQYKPSQGFPAGLEVLPDGTYDFQITGAFLERTNRADTIFRLQLKVLNTGPQAGTTTNNTYWFMTQENVDILGGDLCSLGFDADKWVGQRPFSRELAGLIQSGKLIGVNFRAHKIASVSKKDGKTYHNLRINARLGSNHTPAPAAYNPTPAPSANGAPSQGEEIPF